MFVLLSRSNVWEDLHVVDASSRSKHGWLWFDNRFVEFDRVVIRVTCTPQAPGPKSLLERVSSLEKNHNASSKIIQDLQREIAKLKGEQPGAEPDESTDTDDDTQSQTAELVEDPDRSEQVSDEEDGENLGLLGTTRSGKRKRYGLPTLPYENGHKRPRAGNEFGESGITSVEEEVALQM
jgi:hypothetical protein